MDIACTLSPPRCAWAEWSVEPRDGEIALVVRSSGHGIAALPAVLEGGV